MAQSRLEKIGTIYSRIMSLLKAGAMKEDNKPLWLDIYKAFPPKYEPRYDRPTLEIPIKPIFYIEDKIIAKFHKDYPYYSTNNLIEKNYVSKTAQFLSIYKQLQRAGISEDQIYGQAVKEFLEKVKTEISERKHVLSTKSQDSQRIKQDSINLKNVFEEVKNIEDKQEFKPIRLSLEKLKERNENEKPE